MIIVYHSSVQRMYARECEWESTCAPNRAIHIHSFSFKVTFTFNGIKIIPAKKKSNNFSFHKDVNKCADRLFSAHIQLIRNQNQFSWNQCLLNSCCWWYIGKLEVIEATILHKIMAACNNSSLVFSGQWCGHGYPWPLQIANQANWVKKQLATVNIWTHGCS